MRYEATLEEKETYKAMKKRTKNNIFREVMSISSMMKD